MSNITDERLVELRRSAPPPYEPERLPFDTFNLLTPELIKLSSEANMALGEYKGFLVNTPNPYFAFITYHYTRGRVIF